VVAAFYYLRVIKIMYFDTGTPNFDKSAGSVKFIMVLGAAATALFVFIPGPLVSAAAAAAKALMG
jgi:NADH-quinone oxidoreductase subunit N